MILKLQDFDKLKISARYWLLGMAVHDPEYNKVLEVMEYGLEHHTGTRNGGEPEFIHQLKIFHWVRLFHRHIKNPVLVYQLIFLHDAVEDPQKTKYVDDKGNDAVRIKFVSLEEVAQRWGTTLAGKLRLISKEIMGIKNPDYSLDTIFSDEDLAIVKAGDRVDNVSTMVGVFKPARLQRYVKETVEEFLDRIKAARRLFPHQEVIFEAAKMDLINQLVLINHIIGDQPAESADA